MDTLEIFTSLIDNLGFPIAVAIAMYWQNNRLRETLDANTKAIQALEKKIDLKRIDDSLDD